MITFIEKGKYFTINRPRQFGKTTTLSLLAKQLNQRDDYVALKISFEEIDADNYNVFALQRYSIFYLIYE